MQLQLWSCTSILTYPLPNQLHFTVVLLMSMSRCHWFFPFIIVANRQTLIIGVYECLIEFRTNIFYYMHDIAIPTKYHDIVACQRGGVSSKPTWAPGSDKAWGQGSFGPFTGGLV